MYTAVVKLDTLTDSVWSAAKDHNLRFILGYRIPVPCIVSRVIISTILCTADMNAFPGLFNPQADSVIADLILRDLQQLAQILIRETVFLCLDQKCI